MIPAKWVGEVLDAVEAASRAAGRSYRLDSDDAAGVGLLALARAARTYTGEPGEGWRAYAVTAARRAVRRAGRAALRRDRIRVVCDLDGVEDRPAAPDPAGRVEALLGLAREVLDGMGLAGAVAAEVLLGGQTIEATARRYHLTERTARRHLTDARRALAAAAAEYHRADLP